MDAGEATSREQIRDVISRYNHAGDRGDLDALIRCFTETGVLDLEGEAEIRGRAAIRSRLSQVVAQLAEGCARPLVRHHVSSILIEPTGPDTARSSSYFLVFTEVGLDHWGRYADLLVRAAGSWEIAHRKVRVDGAAPGSRMAGDRRGAPAGSETA
jgi:ketosteroid isomerase-like protein